MRYILREMVYGFFMIIHKMKNKGLIIGFRAKASFDSQFEGNNKLANHSFFKGKMGFASYIGAKSIVVGKVGRYCSIADNVTFLTLTHPVKDFVSTHPCFYSLKKQSGFTYTNIQKFDEEPVLKDSSYSIEIGNDVYIGEGVTIIGPVRIGDGAVIAAGSVVTKNIMPFSIWGGVPAKIIRMRFTDTQIDFLKELRWWDKDSDWLRSHADKFESIEELMENMGFG